jgi:hypothetical protein
MDREPTMLQKAAKYVKTAIANQHALYGSKARVIFAQRQVLVPSREEFPTRESSGRATPKLYRHKDDSSASLDEVSHLTSMVEKLTTAVQQPIGRQQNPSSYAVKRVQFLEKPQIYS